MNKMRWFCVSTFLILAHVSMPSWAADDYTVNESKSINVDRAGPGY